MTREEFQIVARQAIEFGRSTVALKLSYDQLMAHDAEQRQVIDLLKYDLAFEKENGRLLGLELSKQSRTIQRLREALERIKYFDGYDGCYLWRESRRILEKALEEPK